jgi:hypothetical protein
MKKEKEHTMLGLRLSMEEFSEKMTRI